MLIGICGGICAGKSTVAQYLVEHHGFKRLRISGASDAGDGSQTTSALGDSRGNELAVANGASGTAVGLHAHASSVTYRPARKAILFRDATELLDFVTTRWRERWVTIVDNISVLDLLARRPFFLLISVDAPVTVRWHRYQQRERQRQQQRNGSDASEAIVQDTVPDLSAFVGRSDAQLFDPATGHMALMARAAASLLNTSSDVAHLFATLGKLDLANEERLRPSWDIYFMSLASLAAERSNCMKRRVGCVVVREKRVVSTGYNGTPRGIRNCGEGGCGRCNEGTGSGAGLATCLCIHAEENALLEAGRDRIRDGAILYCDTCPCLTCSIKIAQVGIAEVVYSQSYSMDTETAAVLREAGVKLRQFVPPAKGVIHLGKAELYD